MQWYVHWSMTEFHIDIFHRKKNAQRLKPLSLNKCCTLTCIFLQMYYASVHISWRAGCTVRTYTVHYIASLCTYRHFFEIFFVKDLPSIAQFREKIDYFVSVFLTWLLKFILRPLSFFNLLHAELVILLLIRAINKKIQWFNIPKALKEYIGCKESNATL